ncbi:transposase [Dokdonella sp. MW10]|uniref:transposase n=1 Tax=Dokdonella sp. MW10 TaxID=2992926 RepID=UPI003F7D15C2
MARLPRIDLAGVAQHVVQRGNNRQACFVTEYDFVRYREELEDAATRHACSVHAWVFMTNHVHLLVTPSEVGGVSRMMQAIGRRYVGGFNARHTRTGTLWEGRFKAALVAGDRYVLACYRYIESNPVRAGMTDTAAGYRWSSHAVNALGQRDALLVPHEAYLRLDVDGENRRIAYAALFSRALDDATIAALRTHTGQQCVWAPDDVTASLARSDRRSVHPRPRGRPTLST